MGVVPRDDPSSRIVAPDGVLVTERAPYITCVGVVVMGCSGGSKVTTGCTCGRVVRTTMTDRTVSSATTGAVQQRSSRMRIKNAVAFFQKTMIFGLSERFI
jgi:hypothetical protein